MSMCCYLYQAGSLSPDTSRVRGVELSIYQEAYGRTSSPARGMEVASGIGAIVFAKVPEVTKDGAAHDRPEVFRENIAEHEFSFPHE